MKDKEYLFKQYFPAPKYTTYYFVLGGKLMAERRYASRRSPETYECGLKLSQLYFCEGDTNLYFCVGDINSEILNESLLNRYLMLEELSK